ncbi:DoxX family membrane protein [Corynebacterium suicordis]
MSRENDFFDDANTDVDVPTYSRDPYAMTGRARPQRIEPKKAEPAEPVVTEKPVAARPVSKRVEEPVVEDKRVEPVTEPAPAEPATEQPVVEKPVRDKRGTLSFGLLLLRLVVGGLLLVHGLQILFAFGGHAGLNTFESQLSDHSHADLLAVGISVAEVVAGGLLILGLLTPLGAALGAVAAGFLALHHLRAWEGGYFPATLDTEVQMWAILAAMSMVILFTGPGRAALDRPRGWATRPLASAWLFAIIAVAGLAGLWFLTA